MSTICRFACRKLPFQLVSFIKPEFLTSTRQLKMNISPYKPRPKETHDEYNMRIGRPQSPHLTIYAPQLPAMISITHRMTGAALAFYTMVFSVGTLVTPLEFACYVEMLSDLLEALNLGPIPVYLGRFVLAFPFCYHMCNGIRHLVWDLGVLLTIKGVYTTGYLMLTTALSLTTVLAVLL